MQPLRAAAGQFDPMVRSEGLWGWRVEKMKAVQLDRSELGVFYSGDAYLVLHNRGGDGADLYMWMGEQSSRDEQCACAMLATQLDHFLGGEPVQHRQAQGFESTEFMKLFPTGVSYKEGGVESGFRKVRSDSAPVRHLYHIKGKKNIRLREVSVSWTSFNKGDCFILDLGQTIILWSGSKSNMFERQRVREVAALIRDTERHGKAHITDVTEGEEPVEMIQVLGPIQPLKDNPTEDDRDADQTNSATLYKVSDVSGCMTLTLLSNRAPFDLELLEKDDCFILDNGSNGKIFVWKGTGANAKEKQVALKVADEFIQKMNYCRLRTKVEILPQGRESVLFKQFFKSRI